MRALLAAMQSGAAFLAVGFEIRAGGQHGRAVETTGRGDGLDQARETRARRILHGARALRTFRPLLIATLAAIAVGVHITVLAVLTVLVHTLLFQKLLDSRTGSETHKKRERQAFAFRCLLFYTPLYQRIARARKRIIVVIRTDP